MVVHEQFPAEAILLKEGRQVLGKAKVETLVKAMADFAEPTSYVIHQLSEAEARGKGASPKPGMGASPVPRRSWHARWPTIVKS